MSDVGRTNGPGRVIPFPGATRGGGPNHDHGEQEQDDDRPRQYVDQSPAPAPAPRISNPLPFMVYYLRYSLGMILLWLRGPVQFLARGVSFLAFVGVLLGAFIIPDEWVSKSGTADKAAILWRLGGVSFLAFMSGWLYDSLLLWVHPEQIFLS